jgi:HD-like signal output (HDOD) protein
MWRSLFGRGKKETDAPAAVAEATRPGSPAPVDATDIVTRATAPEPENAAENAHQWWRPTEPMVVSIEDNGPGPAIDGALYSELGRALDNAEFELPQLPVVVREVLAMLNDRDVNLSAAASVAERDPVLTAEVIRVVNAVAYRAMRPVERLNQAFPRLGVRKLRAMLVGASMKSLAIRSGEGGEGLGAQLWRASNAAAIVAGETAREVGQPEDEAYLAGLLHDIGHLVLLKILHDYQQKTGRKVTRQLFEALARRWHEPLGLRLASNWGMPDPLPELIGNHHRTPSATDPLARTRHILAFTDAACALMRYSTYVPYDLFALPASQALGFDDSPGTHTFLASLPPAIRARMKG